MAELKTKKTKASPEDFLNTIKDEGKREDSLTVMKLMKQITGDPPEMWGPSIIGFGHRVLKYDSGRELDWMKIGFSPRKEAITLYVLYGSKEQNEALKKLGKFKTGKGCLYIKKLEDVDMKILKTVIQLALKNKGKKVTQ